jgi:hypothetical protein
MRKSLSVIDYQGSFSRTAELAYSLFTICMGWCFATNSSIFAFDIGRDEGLESEHITLDINRSCLGVSFSRDHLKNIIDEAVD